MNTTPPLYFHKLCWISLDTGYKGLVAEDGFLMEQKNGLMAKR
jgi:hypothetical protein